MRGYVTDCCNGIVANREAGLGQSYTGLMLQDRLWSWFPRAKRLHSSLLLVTVYLLLVEKCHYGTPDHNTDQNRYQEIRDVDGKRLLVNSDHFVILLKQHLKRPRRDFRLVGLKTRPENLYLHSLGQKYAAKILKYFKPWSIKPIPCVFISCQCCALSPLYWT